MNSFSNKGRTRLLLTVGTAMAVSMIATNVQAAQTTATPAVPPTDETVTFAAHDVLHSVQEKILATTSAPIADATIGVDTTNADTVDDPTDTTAVTVKTNSEKANATANDFSHTIDLSVVPPAGALGAGDGAASLGVQFNSGPVSASLADDADDDAEGGEIYALLENFSSGTVAVTDNTIGSTAIGNNGSTLLHGPILSDYASAAAGFSNMTFNVPGDPAPNWLDAGGSLVASTVQIEAPGEGPISDTALTSEADVLLSVLNTNEDSAVTGAATLAGNTVAATVAGNSSNSAVDLRPGGAAAFTGTAVVSNGQINASPATTGSSITATNERADIVATVAADGTLSTDDAELQGSLAVTGNAITSSASGNQALGTAQGQAGNGILLADGMSFQGSAGTAAPGAGIAYNAGSVTDTVDADLVINNSQGSVGAGNEGRLAVTGSTDDGRIAAVVDDIAGGSVAVSGNGITGTANGNAASSALASGANMASFAGSAALANQQSDYFTNVLAESTGDIYAAVADDDDLSESAVSVNGNTVGASAYGNSISQSLALDAAVQNLPLSGVSLTGGTGPDGNVSSEGSVTVSSLQANYNSDVDTREVHNIYATVSDEGDSVLGSSVAVNGNTGEAVSVGSSAANSLTLAGTTDAEDAVSGGAGIASVQILDDSGGDDVDATEVSASSTGIVHLDSPAADSSGLTLSDNLQRGVAYGGLATNTLKVSAETATIDGDLDGTASSVSYDAGADRGLVLTHGDQPEVDAAHGVLNVQSLNGDVAAQALPAGWTDLGSSFAVIVDGDLTGGSVVNGGHIDPVSGKPVDGNALVAAAYGADATNAATLDTGNLGTSNDDFASVMNVTNVQEVTDSSSVVAQASGGAAVLTQVTGDNDVEDASVSTSYNTVQALAYGNRAANSVSVAGNTIDTEADFFPIRGEAAVVGEEGGTDASFSVDNAQAAGGSIAATLLDNPEEPASSAAVLTVIGGDVTDSSVTSNGNALSSGATGNRADNQLALGGNGLATTSAITNFQIVSEDTEIRSDIGIAGSGPTPFVPGTPDTLPQPFDFDVTGSGLTGTTVDSQQTVTGGTLSIPITDLSEQELAYLQTEEGGGWTISDSDLVNSATILGTIPLGDYADLTEGGTYELSDALPLIPGTPDTPASAGSPNVGGVTIAIGGDIDPSTVAVNGNTVAGSVTGNSASNSLVATGNGVEDGSDHLLTYAVADGTDTRADGDHMLANLQVVDGEDTDLTSNVYGTFAIDTDDGIDIAAATLTVDGNSQSSRAVANTADNRVTLAANNTAAGAVLASNQASGADVEATSNVDLYAPAASVGSSVSISDNQNLALGVVNDATNTLTVAVNNAGPVTDPIDAIADVDSNAVAFGDHVLLNQQIAEDTVNAEAVTTIYNQDGIVPATSGVSNGSVTVSGNSTMAEASANRATNVAKASAGSSLGAAVGVTNSQSSSAQVTSSSTTSAGVTLAGNTETPAAALNAGSMTVGGNTTTALARGNAATNALNYSAGANYGTGTDNAVNSSLELNGAGEGANGFVVAQAAVLNSQTNSGPVSASSTDATYLVALNTAGGPAITNGTVGVIGNSVSAQAYGNTATNSLTLTSLNTGQPTAAIGNYQSNSAAVTASVTTVSYGVTSGLGAITGSALSVTGNSVTATAIGNSAVSSIGAAH